MIRGNLKTNGIKNMMGLYPYHRKRIRRPYLLMFLNTDQTTYIDGIVAGSSCRAH